MTPEELISIEQRNEHRKVLKSSAQPYTIKRGEKLSFFMADRDVQVRLSPAYLAAAVRDDVEADIEVLLAEVRRLQRNNPLSQQ